jgi:Transglycosylase SLT domain
MKQSYIDIVNREAARNNIPPQMLLAVIKAESSGNPNAVSSAGAQGLMQLMPETARELGVKNPKDPEQNIAGGAKYIRQLLNKYNNDPEKAMAAYNWGMGNVDRKGVQGAPAETQNYLAQLKPQLQNYATNQGIKYGTNQVANAMFGPSAATTAANAGAQTGNVANLGSSLASSSGRVPVDIAANAGAQQGSSYAAYAAPALATAAGAYGAYNLHQNRNNMSRDRGALQGAASGAALGSFGGPIGMAVGAGIGGLYGLTQAGKPTTREEEKRLKEAYERGNLAQLPQWVLDGVDIKAKDAGFRKDLAADFIGNAQTAGQSSGGIADSAGDWVNNKFAKSRNVADLRAEDIWGYGALMNRFGPQYMGGSEENRRAISQKALDLGLVKEAKGSIQIADSKELDDYWKSLQNQTAQPSGQPRPQSGPSQPRPITAQPVPPRPLTPPPVTAGPSMPIIRPYQVPARPQGDDYIPAIMDVNNQNSVRQIGELYSGGRQTAESPFLKLRTLYS